MGCIRFKGLCPVPERECLPALVEPRVEIDEATAFVVPLIDHRTRATCLTGGKASSLAFLMSLKDITDDEVRKLGSNKIARKMVTHSSGSHHFYTLCQMFIMYLYNFSRQRKKSIQ